MINAMSWANEPNRKIFYTYRRESLPLKTLLIRFCYIIVCLQQQVKPAVSRSRPVYRESPNMYVVIVTRSVKREHTLATCEISMQIGRAQSTTS